MTKQAVIKSNRLLYYFFDTPIDVSTDAPGRRNKLDNDKAIRYIEQVCAALTQVADKVRLIAMRYCVDYDERQPDRPIYLTGIEFRTLL